jgi:hypothetical protein
MTSLQGLSDYLAAVEERRHLERLLENGSKEFSGYGLELFASGLSAKIKRLDRAIEQYAIQTGYAKLVSCSSLWNNQIRTETLDMIMEQASAGFSLASSSLSSACDTANVQMIPGRVRDHVTVLLESVHFPAGPVASSVNSYLMPVFAN